MATHDSNGTELNEGDVVLFIKGLNVKGMFKTLKWAIQVGNTRLVVNQELAECRIGKFTLVLKTTFTRKILC